MELSFPNNKTRKTFSQEKTLRKTFGQLAPRIMQRIKELQAALSLADISHLPPPRCHELSGDRKGVFSVDVSPNERLLFRPTRQPPETKMDGGIDLEKVRAVIVLGVDDTHEGKNRR